MISSKVTLLDTFIGGSAETGEIGDLGWQFTAAGTGTVSKTASVYPYAGLVTLATGTTANQATAIHLSGGVSTPTLPFSFIYKNAWAVTLTSVANIRVRFGIGSNLGSANWGSDGIFWEFDSSASANWRLIIRVGGSTIETLNSGVAANITDVPVFGIQRTSDVIYGRIWDGSDTEVESSGGSLPAGDAMMVVGAYVETLTASSKNLTIDDFGLTFKQLQSASMFL
jgi:hypothetical protein